MTDNRHHLPRQCRPLTLHDVTVVQWVWLAPFLAPSWQRGRVSGLSLWHRQSWHCGRVSGLSLWHRPGHRGRVSGPSFWHCGRVSGLSFWHRQSWHRGRVSGLSRHVAATGTGTGKPAGCRQLQAGAGAVVRFTLCRRVPPSLGQVKSRHVTSSQVKSSQVKSSQLKSSQFIFSKPSWGN